MLPVSEVSAMREFRSLFDAMLLLGGMVAIGTLLALLLR
jgi:hypothetical protein